MAPMLQPFLHHFLPLSSSLSLSWRETYCLGRTGQPQGLTCILPSQLTAINMYPLILSPATTIKVVINLCLRNCIIIAQAVLTSPTKR